MDLGSKSILLYYSCTMRTVICFALAGLWIFGSPAPTETRVAIAHALPKLDGEHLKATIVEVSYGPGGSSAPHSHPCPVIGYVLNGALRMKVNDEPEKVYKAGETF